MGSRPAPFSPIECLMLLILWGIRIIAWCYGVLATNLAVNTLDLQFTTTGVLKHLLRRCRCLSLCIMQRRSSTRIITFVCPTTVGPPRYRATLATHNYLT